jgi:uncharacterized protein YgbK (DUF1537 family)
VRPDRPARPGGPLLGCIADDLTGATDVGGSLTREGWQVVQVLGVPDPELAVGPADALVVALKSRSIEPGAAVDQSLRALRWLQRQGCERILFKYCSTFDSTDGGNIGPVADALLAALGVGFAVVAPAFPRNGRTVYQGHLFVDATLLSESGMRHHPVTPMTDPNLVRVLGRQTDGPVGLIDYSQVVAGADTVRSALSARRGAGDRYAVVDALDDTHLVTLAEAVLDHPLVTGGSALAWALSRVLSAAGDGPADLHSAAPVAGDTGPGAVIAGSCSTATLLQIERMRARHPVFEIDVAGLADGRDVAAEALLWALPRIAEGPVLIHSSASPERVQQTLARLGRGGSGLIEQTLGAVARGLVEHGVRRMVVAGGETSGAVMQALDVRTLLIGQEIEPGVPVAVSLADPHVAVVLKSGNFGSPDFFAVALDRLAGRS